MTQKRKTPAKAFAEAGAACAVGDSGSEIASNCDSSTFSKRGQRKTQHGNLPPGDGLVGSVWSVGDLTVSGFESNTVSRKKEALSIELAMGAATPLDSDAHLCSPARRVDEKPSLRRKQARTTTWLTGLVYRVYPNLLVEALHG